MMIQAGEIRCYVGGRMELFVVGDGVFSTVWVPGVMVCRARYSCKGTRAKIIEKMVETWKDVEIAIRPDDMEALAAELEIAESEYEIEK